MTAEVRAPANRTAKDVMTRGVLSVQPDWPVEQLNEFLVRHRIHGAPVVSAAGELLGVVSLTDIARAATLTECDLSARDRHDYYSRLFEEPWQAGDPPGARSEAHAELLVHEIMTPVAIVIDENADIREIARRMLGDRVHRLFVTREGRVVGVVTAHDLLQVIRDL
ncbi:MAG: CBS domain-containing protein [Candidatus Eiseniibacteriota bacterium]